MLWRLAPARVVHRIRTAVWVEGDDPARCFDRVDEALDLLERYDPPTLESLQEHFGGIFVFGNESFRWAYWAHEAALCVMTRRYLESPDVTPEDVALTMVHENMHAKLRGAGVPYKKGRRAAIEVICAMAELAVARRIPYPPDLAERIERKIEDWSHSDEARWSEHTMRAAALEHLREMGTPRWIFRLVRLISRFGSRRAA